MSESRYTKEQLTEMAKRLQKARQERDGRYFEFVMTIVMITDCEPDFIDHKIDQFAAGIFSESYS